MQPATNQAKPSRLALFPSGDPNTAFGHLSPAEILKTYGHPRYLLSSSAKAKKCLLVRVLTRILYLTSGLFCSHADSCLYSCLAHTSGRMPMADCVRTRDQRTALYLESPELFIKRLHAEIALHEVEANRRGLQSAVRLNGGSDLLWERRHRELFFAAPDTQFFDYTKIPVRMNRFLAGEMPDNYHLTFSAGDANHDQAKRVLDKGGNVAVVFWPELPINWWGFPVLDGDTHDARFLDPAGSIVGLRAKGVARVDLAGFVVRPCPECNDGSELVLESMHEDTHRHTCHRCRRCRYQLRSRWMAPRRRHKDQLVQSKRREVVVAQCSNAKAA
ncbi:hypothetical protein NG895_02110 [Aeoliella sp. ICT_H6.2]|uniref:Gene product 88 domain-containing protein n=1 Tax=Aeoliella straminimaris TaxID=2954799 RepID=A0A9X2F5R4_9BACT|nr:hypothetical protein [Aeoliella straminimaris]MCO6042690.1 hypothetical protein [Aeoliella straminimaris]